MTTYDLSVLIPARNEYYYDIDLLGETVRNVLANTSERTEIIVVLDGAWSKTPLQPNPRLTVIHHSRSIGQRAATNEAARVARGEWVMKLDAHCALSPEFDTNLLKDAQPDWTIVPAQYNLLAFIWKCKRCDWVRDQSPKPEKCEKCGSQYTKQVVRWIPRDGREGSDVGRNSKRRQTFMQAWRFDSKLEYQPSGWGEYCKRPEVANNPIHDTMTLLGACWTIRRERYFQLNMSDEKYGSWGQQGTEVACKSWLSGGRLVCNTNAWFAHFFRVGGIPFPYEGGGQKERAMARCREMWLQNKWEHQTRPLSWLIEKFKPIPDWHTGDGKVLQQINEAGKQFYQSRGLKPGSVTPTVTKTISKGILYYTCNTHDEAIELAARAQLLKSRNGYELGCVSRERTDFGDWNIVVQRPRSGTTMHYQILEGLRRMRADYVFLCESDVFYHPSHFDFQPPRDDTFYYNTNVWRVRYSDGHAVWTDNLQQVSGICASRQLLLAHYQRRVELIAANGDLFDVKQMAYEPGTRGKFGDEQVANWRSEFPNVDLTGHGATLTKPHFSIDEFRNKRYAAGWRETDDPLPGWPPLANRVQEFLKELSNGEQINLEQAGRSTEAESVVT